MLGGHQWPIHNEKYIGMPTGHKMLQVTQRQQSCKNDKCNPMLHSETENKILCKRYRY